MIQYIFTIHDKKAEAYLPPFFLPQTGMATRTFADCCNDEKHAFSKHPQDYTLMALGTYDDNTAIMITTPPESIGNGLDFLKPELETEHEEIRFGKTLANTPNTTTPHKGNSL